MCASDGKHLWSVSLKARGAASAWWEVVDRFSNPDFQRLPFRPHRKWRARMMVTASITFLIVLSIAFPCCLVGQQIHLIAAFTGGLVLVLVALYALLVRWTSANKLLGYAYLGTFFFLFSFLSLYCGTGGGAWTAGILMLPMVASLFYGTVQCSFVVVLVVLLKFHFQDVFVFLQILIAAFGLLAVHVHRDILSTVKSGCVQKEELLTNVAHDLRTPVQSFIGIVDMLAETPLNDAQTELLACLRKSQKSLLDLVNNVLMLSFLTERATLFSLQPSMVDIYELLHEVYDAVRFSLIGTNVSLIVFPPDLNMPTRVHIDSVRLKQILFNLLSNAVKFTTKGQICMSCMVTRDSGRKESRLTFSISDTGIGMTKEVSAAILAGPLRFRQTNEGTARGGFGLGLSIAQVLLSKMNSFLEIASEVGKGTLMKFSLFVEHENNVRRLKYSSLFLFGMEEDNALEQLSMVCETRWNVACDVLLDRGRLKELSALKGQVLLLTKCDADAGLFFQLKHLDLKFARCCSNPGTCKTGSFEGCVGHVLLPVSIFRIFELIEAKEEKGSITIAETKRAPFAASVLVAEDNAVVQKVLLHQLVALGFRLESIKVARNGEEALAVATSRGENFDVGLFDCEMPLKSGFEVVKYLRERNVQFPILLHSALLHSRDEISACGGNGFVLKPFSKRLLQQELSSFIDFT